VISPHRRIIPVFVTVSVTNMHYTYEFQIHFKMCRYKEDYYFVDWFHSSPLHNDQDPASNKAYMNFVNKSECVTADNVRNEVVTIHRSQEVLKMLSLYM
jgi:hypothetical protein